MINLQSYRIHIDEDAFEADKPLYHHGRRASAAAWPGHDRYPPVVPVPSDQQERAAGLLRRLSLGGNMARVSSHDETSCFTFGEHHYACSIAPNPAHSEEGAVERVFTGAS